MNSKKTYFLQIQIVSRKINDASSLFLSQFWPFLNRALFFEAAGAVLKIGLSLKPNHHQEI